MELWFLCSEIQLLLASVSDFFKVKVLNIESIFISCFAAAAIVATSATTTDETVPTTNAAIVTTAAYPTDSATDDPPATEAAAAVSPVNSFFSLRLTFI